MSVVDVSDVSADFFILAVVFILLIFGLLSFGILKMFQQRFRTGWFSFAGAIVSSILFLVIINTWYV
ncbi:hypothetical protein ACFP56_07200 [Paenibacillus septentrionalis]|uniref:DUF2759 domain-containing protein n=1 Tax=Paenibacillus septentrionalis TaxID=429342 RepID=A0ABW1V455_9BACL